jgi:hypothetical protein
VAKFLDARDMKREALEIATDNDYRFELAVSLGELGIALELAEESGSELKWRQLGELALSAGKLKVCPCVSAPWDFGVNGQAWGTCRVVSGLLWAKLSVCCSGPSSSLFVLPFVRTQHSTRSNRNHMPYVRLPGAGVRPGSLIWLMTTNMCQHRTFC